MVKGMLPFALPETSTCKRADLQRLSGQKLYPVIEFENGSIYREDSKDMAATIRAGKFDEKRGAAG